MFSVGDKVWLESYNLSTDDPSKKLTAKQLGPYEIMENIGSNSHQLAIPVHWRVHNMFHASLLSKTKDNTILGWVPELQPMVQIQD
jgi:hypothetical protein